jgi:hypothetical protein
VKVDAQDNIRIVDRGSNMVIKFDPAGRVMMTFSRKPESVSPVFCAKSRQCRPGEGNSRR